MRTLVIGEDEAARELAARLHAAEVPASLATAEPPDVERTEVGALANHLIALELQISEEHPDAVLVADAGDRALAGALAAAKLVIPLAAVGELPGPEKNAELIRHLAVDRLAGDAAELAAWIRDR